jgi:broad specificity phosphatase PhoE
MNLYVVRHGETTSNYKKIITGALDPPLTQKGVNQILLIANKIPNTIQLIYSSTFSRCISSAEIINKNIGVEIVIDAKLNERSFGLLQGKSWEDIDSSHKLRELDFRNEYDYKSYGGEDYKQVSERVKSFLTGISGSNIVIVTSSGILRILYNLLQNRTVREIENGSLHKFKLN